MTTMTMPKPSYKRGDVILVLFPMCEKLVSMGTDIYDKINESDI